MEASTKTRPAPILGSELVAELSPRERDSHQIVVIDKTSPGTWSGETVTYPGIGTGPKQLLDTVWSTKYFGLYFLNRSPWIEHGYAGPVADVTLLAPGEAIPAGAWVAEFADTSDQAGAIGYHEGQALTGHLAGHTVVATHVSKVGDSGVHAERVRIKHEASGIESVLMRTFVVTAREDNVYVTEVATHELAEAVVDPYVNNESEIRVYANPADGYEYIGEVGDPVQERAKDVGALEGRPCGVAEAFISDIAYPAWWGQKQWRTFTSLMEEFGLAPRVEPFVVAPGGYMSRRKPGGEWEQEFGSKHADHKPNPQ
jgi:hypothetical protein